jgi:hypothetical protein
MGIPLGRHESVGGAALILLQTEYREVACVRR